MAFCVKVGGIESLVGGVKDCVLGAFKLSTPRRLDFFVSFFVKEKSRVKEAMKSFEVYKRGFFIGLKSLFKSIESCVATV